MGNPFNSGYLKPICDGGVSFTSGHAGLGGVGPKRRGKWAERVIQGEGGEELIAFRVARSGRLES